MTNYSLLFIDEDENIEGSKQVACSCDGDAMAVASQEARQHRAIEVWDGDRSLGLALERQHLDRAR
jgi:hypothetical protein